MNDMPSRAPRSLRERMVRGVAGQGFGMAARVLVQLGMVGVMLPAWGVQLYGEWLTLVGIALLLGASDLGFMQAAGSDMVFAAARDDRDHARDVFRTVGCGLGVVFTIATLAVVAFGTWAPWGRWLGLQELNDNTAAAILVMVALQAMGLMTCMLIFCGYASVGDYGDAFAILSLVYVCEWVAAASFALAGHEPLVATAAFVTVRLVGTVAMYLHMRRRVPWLSLGLPVNNVHVRKRLMKPALAGAGIAWGTAVSLQVMVVLVTVVAGAAASAVFATVRAVSRIVIQIATAVGQGIGPEFARAFGEGDIPLMRTLQRRVTQIAVWSALAMALPLAIFGDSLVSLITKETVTVSGAVLLILLAAAVIEVGWFSSGTNLYVTNRHARVGLIYTLASVASLGLAFVLVPAWGIDGAALAVLALSLFMAVVMVRASLRGTDDTLGAFLKAVADPRELVRAISAFRPGI